VIPVTYSVSADIYTKHMKINAEWHTNNKMPKNPTLDQRVAWHIQHAAHCQCRPLEGKMLGEIKKKGFYVKKNRVLPDI
jgi:hypothetical protein